MRNQEEELERLREYRRNVRKHVKHLERNLRLYQEIARKAMAQKQTMEAIASKTDYEMYRRFYHEHCISSKRSPWRKLWELFR